MLQATTTPQTETCASSDSALRTAALARAAHRHHRATMWPSTRLLSWRSGASGSTGCPGPCQATPPTWTGAGSTRSPSWACWAEGPYVCTPKQQLTLWSK
eukprot:12513718-Alexandrium_andersonii.AAC.1